MYDFFVKLLNMSLAASIIVLVIVVLRLLLKKAPKNIICILWALVALRLILPFSIQSDLSAFNMMPSSVDNQGQIEYFQYNGKTEKPKVVFSVPALVDDNASPDSMTVGEHTSDLYLPPVISIWLAGVCVMLLYAIGSYLYLRKKVGASIPRREGLKMSDDISTPFILGILKPVIYIPSGMDEKTLNHVVAHEKAHIKRRDHWWKPLGYCLLTVYWFNPIIWLAYVLLCRDIEMACDEKVIRDMDKGSVAAYSQALLDCSIPRRRIAACPLAFGEVGVKERVKTVLNYKKPAFWIIAVAVVACILIAVCFLTNPKTGYMIQEGDANGVGIRFVTEITAESETVTVKWVNSTSDEAVYGAPYDIERLENGEWISCAKSETFFILPAYSLRAGKSAKKEYGLSNFDLTQPGEYRFVASYHFDKDRPITEDKSYKVWTAFTIGLVSQEGPSAVQWFDSLHGDEMIWDGMREINLDEFPGVTFRWFSEKLEAVTEKETITLYTGMPIWSVYFCDLNGDGKPEICSSISLGSGIIDNRIIVADYANKGVYELSDRGYFDYVLTCQDGQLWAEKRTYMQDEVLEAAPLMLRSVIGTDGTATPMLMFGQSELQNKTNADIVQGMEVGDIVYVGDIAIQKAPDDDDGPSGPVTRSTTEGFEVKSFGGNTSVDKVLNLDSTYRYFYIYIKNTGGNTISVTIGNNSSTQSNNFHEIPTGNYYIWSTNQWAAQSHDVSFSCINGMYGSAKALLSVLPFDGSTATVDALREKYPEYFDLPTGKGLEVYVWQMAQNSYSFGVLSGTNRYKSPEELWNLKGVSAEEMKAILSTYDIDEQNIYIYPWQNPISSYIAEYWITQEGEEQSSVEARRQAYVDNIRSMLFD